MEVRVYGHTDKSKESIRARIKLALSPFIRTGGIQAVVISQLPEMDREQVYPVTEQIGSFIEIYPLERERFYEGSLVTRLSQEFGPNTEIIIPPQGVRVYVDGKLIE